MAADRPIQRIATTWLGTPITRKWNFSVVVYGLFAQSLPVIAKLYKVSVTDRPRDFETTHAQPQNRVRVENPYSMQISHVFFPINCHARRPKYSCTVYAIVGILIDMSADQNTRKSHAHRKLTKASCTLSGHQNSPQIFVFVNPSAKYFQLETSTRTTCTLLRIHIQMTSNCVRQ